MRLDESILIITIIVIIFILFTKKKKPKKYKSSNNNIDNDNDNEEKVYYRNSHSVYYDRPHKNKNEYKKYRYNVENYKIKSRLLKEAEIKFYNVLKSSINEAHIICPKVKISNFIEMYIKTSWEDYYDKIKYQSIDFLICDELFKPVFGIVLFYGDFKLQTEDEKNLNEIYEAIKLPILHFEMKNNLEKDLIKEEIENFLDTIENEKII